MLLNEAARQLTFTEMAGTPGGEDFNEGGTVFAFPSLSSLIQSPGITVNQLLRDSFSPAGL